MNFELTQEHRLIQKTAKEFAQNELLPEVLKRDESKIWPKEAVAKMADLGFLGIMVDEKYGGSGMDTISYTIAMEEIAKVDAAASVIMSVNNSLVCSLLSKFGDEFQKEIFLKKLSKGEKLGAFSLSEPQSGSDASNMLTFAKKENDSYILNGTKNWVTNGKNSDIVIVAALTTKDVGHKGISCFIVEKSFDGFESGKPEKKLGIRSSDTTELYFDNVRVPKENLIGEEGDGFKICLETLDGGRIGIASQALGIAQASLDASIKYSKERKQFNKPIAAFQALQFKIADMNTELVAARQMVRLAAFKLDTGDSEKTTYCAMAKRYATDVGFNVCNEALQVHGGYGYIKEYPLERHVRDVRVHQILEGTNEIMRVIIARRILAESASDVL